MNRPMHFEITAPAGPLARWRDFARAVVWRLTWKAVAVAGLSVYILNQIREIGATFNAPIVLPPPPKDFGWSIALIETCQAACTLVAVLIADEAVERGARRERAYPMAVVLGTLVASIAQYLIRGLLDWRVYANDLEFLLRIGQPMLLFCDQVLPSALAVFVYARLRTARRAVTRRQDAEIARLQAQRSTLESKLQAMQARVEPQFLFNTLAQVGRLYEIDAAKAGKMLDDLIAYLRAALPHLRESSSTLGKEAALASAYLDIVRIRLGERLSFDIAIPPELADARMPPMMLLPLIDHALVYGIERQQEAGGTMRIESMAGDGKLRLTITDSGAGFVPGGNEADLQSIGDRLEALYGSAAGLRRESLKDSGTRAILEIPYETADRGHR